MKTTYIRRTTAKRAPKKAPAKRPRTRVTKRPRRFKSVLPKSSVLTQQQREKIATIPPLATGDLRVAPVCGVGWVTTNMSFVEYGGEIVIIDAGFGFGDAGMPGVNYTIPNTAYLRANRHKIKAIVITHGHLDHIGALPYVLTRTWLSTSLCHALWCTFDRKKAC